MFLTNSVKKLINAASRTAISLIGNISKILSISNRYYLGVFVGNIIRLLSKKRADVTYNNIKMAFPELSNKEITKIAKQAYHNLGITLVELLAFPKLSIEDYHKYVHYENIELINEALSRNKGLILLSGHFGNWELLATTAGSFSNIPIKVVVKAQSNSYFDRIINNYRTMMGNQLIPMDKAARELIYCIKKNEPFALLVDQSADSSKDIFVDFFGRPAATYEAPAQLSYKYDVPILYGFAVRNAKHTYNVKLYELDRSGLDKCTDPIRELTIRHVKALEDIIKQYPGQWSWQHKRWKHTPPKEYYEN